MNRSLDLGSGFHADSKYGLPGRRQTGDGEVEGRDTLGGCSSVVGQK